jgi:hypothetical protein
MAHASPAASATGACCGARPTRASAGRTGGSACSACGPTAGAALSQLAVPRCRRASLPTLACSSRHGARPATSQR